MIFMYHGPFTMQFAEAKGCGISFKFDKFVFESESVIPIKIEDVCQIYLGKIITVLISSPDIQIDPNTGWPSRDIGSNVYLDRKLEVKGQITEVEFIVPQSSSDYRFLITLRDDETGETKDQVIIFASEKAEAIAVSNYAVPESISAGSELEISATLTDGLGNAAPSLVLAFASVQRPLCDPSSYPTNPIEIRLLRQGVENEIRYNGRLLLPSDLPSGLYDVKLTVHSSSRGYQYPDPAPLRIQIESGVPPVTTLFHNVRELNTSIFSKVNSGVRYAVGDEIVLSGHALTDDCFPLGGLNVVGELYDLPTPLIRSTAITDENGNFTLRFQTFPRMHPDTQYFLTLRGQYSNSTYTWTDHYVSLDQIIRYPFEVDNKSSTAEVMSNQEGKLVSLSLDKQYKEITAIVESQKYVEAQYNIAIPSELLSGDIVILKDGGEPLVLIGDQYFADSSGPELDPANNDIRHSYYLNAFKAEGVMVVGFTNLAGGRTTIEITGTSVIPEYGAITALVSAIALMIALVGIATINKIGK